MWPFFYFFGHDFFERAKTPEQISFNLLKQLICILLQTKPRKIPQQEGPPKPPAPSASSTTSSALKALREQLKKKGPPVPTVRETAGGASNDGDSRDHHNNKVPPPPPSGKKPGVALEKQREIRRSLNKNSEKVSPILGWKVQPWQCYTYKSEVVSLSKAAIWSYNITALKTPAVAQCSIKVIK